MKYIKKPLSDISGKSYESSMESISKDILSCIRRIHYERLGSRKIKGTYINYDILISDIVEACRLYNLKINIMFIGFSVYSDKGNRYYTDFEFYSDDEKMEFDDISEHNFNRIENHLEYKASEYKKEYNISIDCGVYDSEYRGYVGSGDYGTMRIYFDIW